MASEVLNTKTKLLITEMLKEIMFEKPLDRIRVSDIVNRCGISRRAFYYHFTDIYEALGWMVEKEWQDLTSSEDPDWKHVLEELLMYFENNRHFCRIILSSSQHFRLERLFCNKLESGIKNYLETAAGPEGPDDGAGIELMIRCYALSITSVLTAWVNDDLKCSKEEMTKLIENSAGYLKAAVNTEAGRPVS